MRLNLGAGYDKRDGWINVDSVSACTPDQVVDLEQFPWPWPDNSVDEVLLRHVLEHLGQAPRQYLTLMTELWRVCRAGAEITIVVPHPRHDHYLNDPTHVRPITPEGLQMFSQKKNREWIEKKLGNTPLGLQLGIDFDFVSLHLRPDEPWRSQLERKQITMNDLTRAMRRYNNVIQAMTIKLVAVKQV